MKKENKIPSFDELKNPNYKYYYSREERLARRRQTFEEPEKKKVKGILGYISGGNPQVKSFIGFYIFIALIFWILMYLNPGKTNEKKIINYDRDKLITISKVKTKDMKGLNVILENRGNNNWEIKSLKINQKFITNISISISPYNFEAIFIPLEKIPNMRNIKIDIE
ncbi:MAG: hypothetical protein N2258_01235 [Brevinematales bacterium]|nr:hypothetical protein [Brevinematales bacterium]